jgi:hypothetical protein
MTQIPCSLYAIKRCKTSSSNRGEFTEKERHDKLMDTTNCIRKYYSPLNMQLFGFDSQVALGAPRICVGALAPGNALDPSKEVDLTVYLEEGIPDGMVRELEAIGHEVKMVSGIVPALFGRGQVINLNHDHVTKQRVYSAGGDGRGDAVATPL